MPRIIFLVEEKSMQVLLNELLPRLFPGLPFLCIPHEGKQDLEKSIPRKLRGWREPGARFVIVRDNDGADCLRVKEKLVSLCRDSGRMDVVVRVICQELEAWYLGDPKALALAYEDESLQGLANRERFRNPDTVVAPARALEEQIPRFQKVSAARLMARHMSRNNRSRSFQVFIEAVQKLSAAVG
jgi:hypothetical protein